MLVKLMYDYESYHQGEIIEMELSAARRLISMGRAALASTQERMKALKSAENKMVANYDNKQTLSAGRKRGRPRKYNNINNKGSQKPNN